MEQFELNGAVIEYEIWGNGVPILLIHPGLCADGLGLPLRTQGELPSRYQLIHYHRRGYMGSTRGSEPLTISCQANDVGALLDHLHVKSAHVVGHSIGAAIALQLAANKPHQVRSLALLEPFLRMVPSAKTSFEQKVHPMITAYRSGNKQQAIQIFCDNIFGLHWRSFMDHTCPGVFDQVQVDIDTFIQELSVNPGWHLNPEQTARIRLPVLSVVGMYSHQIMFESRTLLHSWFPQTEDLDVQTTHLLQMQDPQGVACGLAEFMDKN